MWKKDGKLFSNPLIFNGRKIFNPKEEQLLEAGYIWEEPPTPEDVGVMPKRYSTLKIIRALGEQWAEYRKQLEINGILDQFFAANYLSETDPMFIAFIATVPEEIKTLLDNCIWEEN